MCRLREGRIPHAFGEVRVCAFNDRGSVRMRARVGDGTRPGVVSLAHGFWPSLLAGGSSRNALTPDGLSDLGGGGDSPMRGSRWSGRRRVLPLAERVPYHVDEGAGALAPRATVAEPSPYPGLLAFTEADAERFFGREAEVEALWERIRRRKLLAVIGPSGVGKTSFLRAGVIPSRLAGWAVAYATPGANPVSALARALGPAVAGDAEAIAGGQLAPGRVGSSAT